MMALYNEPKCKGEKRMTFFKNTEFLKVLSFFMICTLLTAGLAPITLAASDNPKSNSHIDEDMGANAYVYASVGYNGDKVQSSHTASCSNSKEGTSLSCSTKYSLSAYEIIVIDGEETQFELFMPVDYSDSGEAVAIDLEDDNVDSKDYYHTWSLEARADLDVDKTYLLHAYTRIEVDGNGGSFSISAHAKEEWGDW